MAVAPAAALARSKDGRGDINLPVVRAGLSIIVSPDTVTTMVSTPQQDWVHGLKIEPAELSCVQLEQPEGINVLLQQQAVEGAGSCGDSAVELLRSAPASDGFAAPAGLLFWRLSLLSQLLVEFPFISARHPTSVVLMNAAATDFSWPAAGLRLRYRRAPCRGPLLAFVFTNRAKTPKLKANNGWMAFIGLEAFAMFDGFEVTSFCRQLCLPWD